MIRVNLKSNLRPLQRAMIDFHSDQVPFAMALALNELAAGLVARERGAIDETFETPTPFTENAYRIEVATKRRPLASVMAKDIQASYLQPYVVGGQRSLGSKRGMLVPRQVKLNQYGNLSKGKLASLKAKPNVFIGPVTFRKGKRAGEPIYGVWERSSAGRRKDGSYGTKGDSQNKVHGARTTLKLLIEFSDSTEAPKQLDFYGRGEAYLRANSAGAFDRGVRRALATKRRR